MPETHKIFVAIDTIAMSGPGKGVLQFCEGLPDDVKVVVANFSYPDKGRATFEEMLLEHDIPYERLYQRHKLDYGARPEVIEYAKEQEFDLVQSHSFKAHFVARDVAKALEIPWVAWAHGWTTENRRVRIYNALERRLLMKADRLCVVSRTLYDEFKAAGYLVDRLAKVPNAIVRVPKESISREVSEGAGLTLVCIGRLSYEKGQDILFDAVAMVDNGVVDRVILLGDGPERGALEDKASQLGLSNIEFAGHVDDISRFMSESDFLVVPSRSEGIPNVILEAMASCLPVISTKVGGVGEMITAGRNGLLCEPVASDLSDCISEAARMSAADREALANIAYDDLYPTYDPVRRVKTILRLHDDARNIKREESSIMIKPNFRDQP